MILLTGGAGFIGSHIAEGLTERKTPFCIFDDFSTGRHENLEQATPVSLSVGPMSDMLYTNALRDIETIIHCAASYDDPAYWRRDIETNARDTAKIGAIAKRNGSRVLYFQTALCYGLLPEGSTPVQTDAPLRPEGSSYALSKTLGGEYLRLSGCHYVELRLANIVGRRNTQGAVPAFWKKLSAQETCIVTKSRRDLLPIDDLMDLVFRVLDNPQISGIFHASTGTDYAISDLYRWVCAAMGIKLPWYKHVEKGPDDSGTIILDPTKTREMYMWEPKTPLKKAIADAVAWYEANGVEKAHTHLKMEKA